MFGMFVPLGDIALNPVTADDVKPVTWCFTKSVMMSFIVRNNKF